MSHNLNQKGILSFMEVIVSLLFDVAYSCRNFKAISQESIDELFEVINNFSNVKARIISEIRRAKDG